MLRVWRHELSDKAPHADFISFFGCRVCPAPNTQRGSIVGRAKVAYRLQREGWRVGEVFYDGYDLRAHHPKRNKTCFIELKTMDITNRSPGVNLTAPVTAPEQNYGLTHCRLLRSARTVFYC